MHLKPPQVSSGFKQWADTNNLPLDDADTSLSFYSLKFEGIGDAYIVDVEGDDPDQFRAVAVFQGGALVGDWVIAGN